MQYFRARISLNPENARTAPAEPASIEPPSGIIPKARARPGLGANDGPADDFIALVEGWEGDDGKPILSPAPLTPPKLAVDVIAAHFSAGQLRQLGASLMTLADAFDDGSDRDDRPPRGDWQAQAGRIERQALHLAQVAIRMRKAAHRRCRHLSGEWFGEPAWEMLLELFIQFAGGARVSTKSLVIASGAPDTTGLRLIDRLEEGGLVERLPSQTDKRVTLVSLTRKGVIAVGMVLLEADA